MPCIPLVSLLTLSVGRVSDSFTQGQGEGIPWRGLPLTHSAQLALVTRLSRRACCKNFLRTENSEDAGINYATTPAYLVDEEDSFFDGSFR